MEAETMSELTDRLVSERLQRDHRKSWAYQHDAQYHSEWMLLRMALDHAHTALLEAGDEDAERIVEILALGIPDADAAYRRIDEASQMSQAIVRGRT